LRIAAIARLPRSPTTLAGSFVVAKLLGVSTMVLENRTKADSSKKRFIIFEPPKAVVTPRHSGAWG
jgi:hypothetical protein